MGWIRNNLKPTMVAPDAALPGRPEPVLASFPQHEIFGRPIDEVPAGAEVTYFALGCYWGAERLFWTADGVLNTAVGFMGGYTPNPTYKETCTGSTGHSETVRVVFDPAKVSYGELLRLFWENHDPTQGNRQGNDIGTQYRSAIFPANDAQRAAAERSRDEFQGAMTDAGYGEITTEITPDQTFYYAEAEHQQYLQKNPAGYQCDHRTGVSCSPG